MIDQLQQEANQQRPQVSYQRPQHSSRIPERFYSAHAVARAWQRTRVRRYVFFRTFFWFGLVNTFTIQFMLTSAILMPSHMRLEGATLAVWPAAPGMRKLWGVTLTQQSGQPWATKARPCSRTGQQASSGNGAALGSQRGMYGRTRIARTCMIALG